MTSATTATDKTTNTNTKTVLITGATRGIGNKLAETYTKLGWNVIGGARDPNKADLLRALSPYKIVQLDTTDEESILRAAADLKDEAIDLVINNAGITIGGGLDVTTKAEMLQQFDVNCVGPFLVTRAFIPHLKAAVSLRGAASVVQVSSYLSSIALNVGGMFGCYGYRASKAALNMTMVSLALDLQSDGIATFAIHPGHVSTDINNYTGEISLDTSVGGMVPLIQKLTIADTGKFYDYNGNSLPW